jgi:hypothetical protein
LTDSQRRRSFRIAFHAPKSAVDELKGQPEPNWLGTMAEYRITAPEQPVCFSTASSPPKRRIRQEKR